MTKSRGINRPKVQWNPELDQLLSAQYPVKKAADIAADLGMQVSSVYHRATALGLKKSSEFFADPKLSGRTDGTRGGTGRIQKGNVPWNKGKKGLNMGQSATRFAKGQQPHNTLPIGSHKLDKDGTLLRKVSDAHGNSSKRWRAVHELVWVEVNGPMPAKHICVFKPDMRTNVLEEITADKVECISFAENMKRNTRHNYSKEINEVIHLRAVLTRHINKRSKHHER